MTPTVTQTAPAVGEDKELLISGSEAVAEALTLADIDVVTGYPIRPYDTVIQAIAKKIANGQLVAEYIVAEGEHSQFEIVKHASMVNARVFCGSSGVGWAYAMECLVVPPKSKVDKYLPRYDRGDLQLHPDNPITVAPQANEDWVIEIRRQNDEAMKRAYTVIEEAYADFRRVFGRGPDNPWFEEYMTDDAEIILLGMGTISLPIKVGIRNMRAKGKKVGLVRLRWFRPFPTDRLVAALSKAKAIGVIDRDYSFGSPFASGVVANEVRAAMYNAEKRPPLLSFISGLGGREVTLEDVYKATDLCYTAANSGKADAKTHWLSVRE